MRNAYIYAPEKHIASVPPLDIREVRFESELKTWLQVVSDGFAGKTLNEPDSISLGQSIKIGNIFFLAYMEGKAVAASTLYVRNKYARLGGMGTLMDYRGKGLQQSMIQYRVELALKLGCTILTSDTTPGNNSQRNLERLGFKVAYVRNVFKRDEPGTGLNK